MNNCITTNNNYITTDINLTNDLVHHNPNENLIILGNITTTSNISIRVNNLVVIGALCSDKDIDIHAQNIYCFDSGKFSAEKLKTKAVRICFGLNDTAIESLITLGLNLISNSSGDLTIQVPKS